MILITARASRAQLCTCKVEAEVDEDVLLAAGVQGIGPGRHWRPYPPVGCERCGGGGYKGRVGINQVMPISEEIQRLILAGGNAMEIAAQAKREGVSDLRESGLRKVRQGLNVDREVLGATNE